MWWIIAGLLAVWIIAGTLAFWVAACAFFALVKADRDLEHWLDEHSRTGQ